MVVRVRTVEQEGLHDGDEKELLVPEGKPDTLNDTAWVLPLLPNVALTLLVTEEAVTTETLPELPRVKSKVLINHSAGLGAWVGVVFESLCFDQHVLGDRDRSRVFCRRLCWSRTVHGVID